jgi:hypothetical protein
MSYNYQAGKQSRSLLMISVIENLNIRPFP